MKLLVTLSALVLLIVTLAGARYKMNHTKQNQTTPAGVVRYLPLGDSYTIGQSVGEQDRWPNQLVDRLRGGGTAIDIIDNPSVTGYTTNNLIKKELPPVHTLKPDFVTILIGVNDYV